MIVSFSMMAFVGAMSLLCFTNLFGIVFQGAPGSEYHDKVSDVGFTMKAAMLVQSVLIVAAGFFPQYTFYAANAISSSMFTRENSDAAAVFFTNLSSVSWVLIVFSLLSIMILALIYLMLRKRSVYRYKTWDCGYQAGNPRMQYTGSSYAEPFLRVFNSFFIWRTRLEKPVGLFPQKAGFQGQVKGLLEEAIINPVISLIARCLNAFTWIQSGRTQQYILYGLIFLIAITLWIMVV